MSGDKKPLSKSILEQLGTCIALARELKAQRDLYRELLGLVVRVYTSYGVIVNPPGGIGSYPKYVGDINVGKLIADIHDALRKDS